MAKNNPHPKLGFPPDTTSPGSCPFWGKCRLVPLMTTLSFHPWVLGDVRQCTRRGVPRLGGQGDILQNCEAVG